MSTYRKEQRTLACKLMPLEVSAKDAEARRQLLLSAKAENERLEHINHATEARKQIKGAQAAALELAHVAAAGVEKRSVTCEWRPHPSAPRMQLHRLDVPEDDTGRIIDERQMTKAEERGAFEPTAGDEPSSAEPLMFQLTCGLVLASAARASCFIASALASSSAISCDCSAALSTSGSSGTFNSSPARPSARPT